jgi:hypothetical protein
MFCLQVKEYKQIVENTAQEKCEQIVNNFIRVGSKHEVNVDASARSAVITQFESKEPLSVHLFDNVYSIVFHELQVGHFPRFIRSMDFRASAAEKGEDYLKLIGYDMRIDGIKDRIMYQPDDFRSTVITDRDIKMVLHMNQDSPDWDLISKDSHDYQVFRSMKQYSIGISQYKFKLIKTVGTLPVSYDKAILANNNFQTKHMYEPIIAEYILLDYIKAGQENDNPYSQLVVRCGMNFSPFHARFYYNFISTVVHDGERNCFIEFGKSSEVYSNVKKEQNQKRGADAAMFYSRTYYRVSENQTRYIEIVYMSHNKYQINAVSKYIGLHRAKIFHNGMITVNEEMAKRDYVVGPEHVELQQTLLDFRDKYEVDGNIKTYELSRTDDSK